MTKKLCKLDEMIDVQCEKLMAKENTHHDASKYATPIKEESQYESKFKASLWRELDIVSNTTSSDFKISTKNLNSNSRKIETKFEKYS